MERVRVLNTNWGMQVVDTEMNDVLFALYDEESPGPHRTPRIKEQAEELAKFYNAYPRPFRENDHAVLKPGILPGHPDPVKVRILKCEIAYGRCSSGWLVTAAYLRGGARPRHPSILVDKADATWFEKA
jgi:hypothetical protein